MDAFFPLTGAQLEQYDRDGFLAVSGLFSLDEAEGLLAHFMELHGQALDVSSPLREFYQPDTAAEAKGEALKQWPRMMMPSRFDEFSKRAMLDARIGSVLSQLLGEPALAAQSMFYFKPPGARGQALHQDNFYLSVQPGSCLAAWVSLDDADEENGGLFVVPGSHRLPVLCPHLADMTKSFTREEVTVPEGYAPVPITLKRGDVLFFNGSVIHGSTPNSSATRFRRAFICHYVGEGTQALAQWYTPLLSFAGESEFRDHATLGMAVCGSEEAEAFDRAQTAFQAAEPVLSSVN